MRAMAASRSADPRQSVILEHAVEKPLVKAAGSEMLFERGAIRIRAQSAGASLVLLPLQFSRCLAVNETGNAKLFRANFLQTALLFHDNIDVRIRFDFGLFRSRCRKEDLSDLASLDLLDGKEIESPAVNPRPYAVSRVADLPRAFEAVVKKLTRSSMTTHD
jgi:hypothetical protein